MIYTWFAPQLKERATLREAVNRKRRLVHAWLTPDLHLVYTAAQGAHQARRGRDKKRPGLHLADTGFTPGLHLIYTWFTPQLKEYTKLYEAVIKERLVYTWLASDLHLFCT